ncbi:glutamine--tRNA ligase/YqeY domain fusion protein [Microbulbifer hydrolyticus]|uniref:Glutamine--tRNA ligase n=1 Tax=Microbulbifer hydrolyticus TaxID=48074 RepID=A0A6P1TB87_9GAMM|nr:glutamine--tRNA ligase/YqeY domain fusion protein [Microbulbifer hydrolyticus]MBB5210623.1 glutaminyl-tRNA synthetase [Microbulbifer hydrolyticus]QHQ38913.1 glutamine--tRNA ligase/YqeY domain fusion protein [Microbulbifer hydrolyticus]
MTSESKPAHFLQNIIREDLAEGRVSQLTTRFPPEPNGYLHIGHAKSICLNFGLAKEFGGECNLRFDDTNPAKEEEEYVDAIKRDVSWLGFEWAGEAKYTSDYFDQLHQWAIDLIKQGKAYVCDLSPEQAREYRGTLKAPGKNSPFRDRSVEENLDLFARMAAGEFDEGSCSLRAKIDMAAPNINLRDPIIYRIKKMAHHQTGDKWCVYPSYDFAHGQSDAIEGISHSICTLEFEDHKPLYDWFIENLPVPARPRQYEFARLHLNYTVVSKRKLKLLVDEGYVDGWDDPRMPTISGMRRRGVTPAAIRQFCEMIGVTRSDSTVDVGMLEYAIRDDLDKNAPRAMCVMEPLKVTLTNYPQGQQEMLSAPGHPVRDDLPARELPFSGTLYIEKEDFREEANKKYKRLVLGKKVRLRNAYVIQADEVVKNDAGEIVEVLCSVDLDTRGKDPADGVKPKGVIHWVSAENNVDCEVRLYDRLFNEESPDVGDKNFLESVNPDNLQVLTGCKAEIGLAEAQPEKGYQFERNGYFCLDSKYGSAEKPVFNRTIGLRDSWAKEQNK